MSMPQATLSVAAQRSAAVTEAVDRVRGIEQAQGVSHASLDAVRNVLRELALQRALFPTEDFPIVRDEQGQAPIYRLSEDADHRFALYMSCSQGAKVVPPHNHTTWAVIVGVDGEEYNTFYERDGSGPAAGDTAEGAAEDSVEEAEESEAYLHVVGQAVVRPGTGVCMLPHDIHHIETYGKDPTLHLHMYGLALEQLTARVVYNLDEGTCRRFTARQNIRPMA